MSLGNFHIALENPNETYYGGQIVSGSLHFLLAKEKKVKGVTVQFHGEGRCSWNENTTVHRNGRNTHITTIYQNHEVYLDQTLYVVGEPGQEMTLPPGSYSYPFRYQLPPTLPSSFEGEVGYVRFVVLGSLIRPWRFDHRCKRAFTVICPLDLNLLMAVQQACHVESDKVLCCCCCASAPITLVVRVPCQGFVPGQRPNALVELDNPTDKAVDLKFSLMQVVFYQSCTGHRYEIQKIVATEKLGQVAKRGCLTQQTKMQIPALPPSSTPLGSCIHISYALQVIGTVGSAHGPIVANIPITLGTIPLMALMQGVSSAAGQPQGIPGPSGIQAGPLAQYPQLNPPSYEECVSGKANIRTEDDNHVQGDMEFAPRYPMYNFQ